MSIERVGIHDNFLELGGPSLFPTQLMAQIPDPFPVEPP
ncbi:hypothetical protein BGS_1400 [Beggiatoa sp. SS]|nr:hypothetical protein BGS_1400 [Beggiatoa sp. SS]